jgi:hypothetical protein
MIRMQIKDLGQAIENQKFKIKRRITNVFGY